MRAHDRLDRVLNGEPVEATEDDLILAELAREIEDVFRGVEPTPFDSGKGLNLALEALRESAPRPVGPARIRRVAARVLVAAAMVLALPTVAWGASEHALPGELLYPVKRAFEQVRLMIATAPLDEAAALLDQAAERLGEATRARALGLDDSAEAAVGDYTEAMARFDQRIDEARRLGLDVSDEMAIASELMEHHDALLDAVSASATTPVDWTAEEGATDPPPTSSTGDGSDAGPAGDGEDDLPPAGETEETVDPADPSATTTDGTICGETSSDGTTCEGTSSEGTTSDGTTSDGTTSEGSPSDGTTSDGTTSDGTTSEGSPSDGTTSDGTTSDGTTADGTTSDGTSDGTTTEGTSGEATTGG